MYRRKEFICSVVANENVTDHFLKLLMMKYGSNKIIMAMVKLMATQTNVKKQKNLYMTITNYINKYGWFNILFIKFGCLILILI